MADKTTAEKKDEGAKDAKGAEGAKRSRTPLIAGAGAVVAIALGAIVATIGLPAKRPPAPQMQGPFVAKLSREDLQVNLAGESSKRFVVLSLQAEYYAYSERYVAARLGSAKDAEGEPAPDDPLYIAMLKDALLKLTSTRTREQVTDPVLMDAFLEEIRQVVDPLLFSVCVGDSPQRSLPDSVSGLKVGESVMDSTMRGLLHEHLLAVDAVRGTLRLDDGPETRFDGKERDLCVRGKGGQYVYLDVTQLKPGFVGEVAVGVPGRLRRIYREQVLVQ